MFQVFDFIWKYHKENFTNSEYIPYLQLKNTENLEIADIQFSNLKYFNYKLSKRKYCIGFNNENGLNKCINTYSNNIGFNLWKPYQIQCFHCERAQGFKSAFFFGEDPNEYTRKHLEQQHYIYLAYFYPGIVKVGTASSTREGIRLIEQDALMFAFIAVSDGFNIQKLEKEISKKLNITQTVRSRKKLDNLSKKIDSDAAKILLKSNIDKVLKSFENTEFESWFFDREKIKIEDITEQKNIYYPEGKVQLLNPEYFNDLEFIPIVGKYLGLRGRFLLIENDFKTYALDTRFLTGRTVEYIDDFKYEKSINSNEQINFFE